MPFGTPHSLHRPNCSGLGFSAQQAWPQLLHSLRCSPLYVWHLQQPHPGNKYLLSVISSHIPRSSRCSCSARAHSPSKHIQVCSTVSGPPPISFQVQCLPSPLTVCAAVALLSI